MASLASLRILDVRICDGQIRSACEEREVKGYGTNKGRVEAAMPKTTMKGFANWLCKTSYDIERYASVAMRYILIQYCEDSEWQFAGLRIEGSVN